ncbi:hypothetical protein GCM10027299_21320 [Larkinella ripae]
MRTAEEVLTEEVDKPEPRLAKSYISIDAVRRAMRRYAAEAVEEQVRLCAEAAWNYYSYVPQKKAIENCKRVELL